MYKSILVSAFLACSLNHGQPAQFSAEIPRSNPSLHQNRSRMLEGAPRLGLHRDVIRESGRNSLRSCTLYLLAFSLPSVSNALGPRSSFLQRKPTACSALRSKRDVVSCVTRPKPSPWPSIRKRMAALLAEIYAEAVTEVVVVAQRMLPPTTPGVPSLRARFGNMWLACIAIFVNFVGVIERLLCGSKGLPVHLIREASLNEISQGVGQLTNKALLPSAYEVWLGARSKGQLALRYTYHADRLKALLALTPNTTRCMCEPLVLDEETIRWVRSRVSGPAPASRLHVWRALKRRLYHYDAGVVAFRGFPRNYLLSSSQWSELLGQPEWFGRGTALDIGAGDGSLNEPMRNFFSRIVATELTTPLVLRLRSMGLDGVLAEELRSEWLGESSFDAVLILNVLDRCKDPFKILSQAHSLLRSDGRLIVSVVLPALQTDAALYTGGSQRRWCVTGRSFETSAASLVQNVLIPAGFEPLRIVRAPYLCAGDMNSPVAALDACVVVLQPIA